MDGIRLMYLYKRVRVLFRALVMEYVWAVLHINANVVKVGQVGLFLFILYYNIIFSLLYIFPRS